jgi:hypothetical protein
MRKYNIKNNIQIYQKKELLDRRENMLKEITKSDGYLPDSILHDDMDKGILDYVINNFIVISDGEKIPVLPKILTIQRWGEISSNWNFLDDDKNIKLPFIAVIRKPDVQPGTNPIVQRTIPNHKTFHYSTVFNWDGISKGANIYKIPQPVAVDITYDISIVCNKFRDLNLFNKTIMQKFSSRQDYINIKGHYIPLILDKNDDSTPMDSLDGRRFYVQNYQFTLLGFLIDSDEFEVKPAINRVLLMNEFITEKNYEKKIINDLINITETTLVGDNIKKTFNVGETISNLLYVSVDNIVLKKDIDYYHIANTSKVTFVETPIENSVIKIVYYKGKNNKLLTDDGKELIVNYEEITINNNLANFTNKLHTFICLDINGILQTITTDFQFINDTTILFKTNISNNTKANIVYLS